MILLPKYVICAKMKMFLVIFLWLFVGNFPVIRGTNTCSLDTTKFNIDTTNVGGQISNETVPDSATYESFYTQVLSGTIDTDIPDTYFEFTRSDEILILSTTETFGNVGKDAYSDGTSVIVILIYVTLKCDDTPTVTTLTITITDAFVNKPIFSVGSYNYTLPMPIMTRTDITVYGDEITATDINFSNTDMTFTIDPPDFDITTSKIDNKTFKAVFSANNILTFTERQIYTLFAVNSGNKYKNATKSNVTITIDVDADAGLDAPSFTKSYYSFNYSNGDPASLTPTDVNDIVIISNKGNEAQYKLDGEDASYFTATFSNETNSFQLSLSESPLPSDVSGQIVLTLSFTTDATTTAILLIDIITENIVPTFSSDYYTGTYDIDTNAISWAQTISVDNAVEVKLSKGKSDLFTIDTTTYEIAPRDQLEKSNFDENWNIVFTVTATSSTNNEADAIVVISLESKTEDEFKFNSVYYAATYTELNGQGVVTLDSGNVIGFTGVSDLTGIEITVDDSYSGNFKCEQETSEWKISVSTNLNETTLNDNTMLAIPLTANKTGVTNSTTAVLILTLPAKGEIKFGSSYYVASYLQGDEEDTVQLDQNITIIGAESDDITIVVEGFDDHFELIFDEESSSYGVSVTTKLGDSILHFKTQLILTVTASTKDNQLTSFTVLVLDLPTKSSLLSFENEYYSAQYSLDSESEAIVTLTDESIRVYNKEALELQFSIEGFDEYFELIFDEESSSYGVNVTTKLDDSILHFKTQLILTVTASTKDNQLSSYTVLVLDLPTKSSLLSFENEHYSAQYLLDSESKAMVILTDESIRINNIEALELQFSIEGFDDYFELIFDEESSSYGVNVTTKLDDSILHFKTQLTLTVTASTKDNQLSSYTVLVLDLPTKSSLLSFENEHYSAQYLLDSESIAMVNLTDESIRINNIEALELQFSIEGFDDYFELIFDEESSSYGVNVTTKLDDSILHFKTQLTLTVTVSTKDNQLSSYTVLVLDLPTKSSLLSFENEHYSAQYLLDSESIAMVNLTDESIRINNIEALELQFSIEGFDDYFELIFDEESSSYGVNVTTKLDDSILHFKTQLTLTVTASTKDNQLSSYTVLVLDLPTKSSLLSFENEHYSAQYLLDSESKAMVNLTDESIRINNIEALELQFSIEGFDDYFELIFDEESSSYGVNVTTKLDDSILHFKTQLILTVTASTKDNQLTSYAVLVLDLPTKSSLLSFENEHYSAQYWLDSESKAMVNLTDESIRVNNIEALELQFSIEEFDEYFELIFDEESSSYGVNVKTKLSDSILNSNTQLILTITAYTKDNQLTSYTVLVLDLFTKSSILSFENEHYSAQYLIDSESEATVNLTAESIRVNNVDALELQFSIEGFDDHFELIFDEESSSYGINVTTKLDAGTLDSNTQLILTITAYAKDKQLTTCAVLVLGLPTKTSTLIFGKEHYSANYIIHSESEPTIELADGVIKLNNEHALALQFSYEAFDKYFELVHDESDMYVVNVLTNLTDSILEANTQLIITIYASSTDGSATGSTVLVLNLPDNQQALKFNEEYYLANYRSDGELYVQLEKAIVLNSEGYTNVQFSFEGYDNNFKLDYNLSSKNYIINNKEPLNDTVISSNSELLIVITASDDNSTATASTVLVLKLPTYIENTFESDYYIAEYQLSTDSNADEVNVTEKTIKITNAEYTQISFTGYESNFKGTCDPTTLECSITVEQNLNSSILSSYEELMLTVIATNEDKSRTGKAILLLRLPSTTSTFYFASQHYSAVYSIQKSDSDMATINLIDVISFEGDNLTNIAIEISDDYSNYFELNLDSSTWKLNVVKNLETDILSNKDELVMTLIATKEDESNRNYAKATLIIKLPDQITLAFAKPQYYAEYVIHDTGDPTVAFDIDSGINVTDSENIEIVLDSFTDNFQVIFDTDLYWYIKCETPLNVTTLSQYSELKILMQISKIGVGYGVAGLTIKLPPFSFSEESYSASYSVVDDVGSINVTDITIANIDPSYVQINLTQWEEYFYTELSDDKWTIKVANQLIPSILESGRPLVTNLVAVRQSDNKTLATSTLVILLPNQNATDAPIFSKVTFSGEYINTDPPTVELNNLISFENNDTISISSVYIASWDQYSTNFSLKDEGNDQYSVEVISPLSQDILDDVTNFAFTLVATSADGNYGYAALVVSLPKALRNSSVQVENQEILFAGTYQDGKFTSPSISIQTDNTDDNAVSVKISNDLGIDEDYFSYTYSKKVLTIQVGELPDDVLNGTSVIPLKLAITDRSTQDTTYAVLNVQITPNSDDNGGGDDDDDDNGDSTDSSRLGLIIAVSILAALLVLVLLGTFFFWYCKLRKNKYVEMNEEADTPRKTFAKKETKKPLVVTPLRRPTGLAIGLSSPTLSDETSTDQDISISTDPLPLATDERKVAFNDEIENIDGHNETDDNEISESLQSVADRRPTKFVFGYALETGVLDIPDERRESSDHILSESLEEQQKSPDLNEIDKKKSVAFDENIERMHIERIEDDEGDSENDESNRVGEEADTSNNDEKEDRFTAKAEIKIGGDEQLPSQILKEIF